MNARARNEMIDLMDFIGRLLIWWCWWPEIAWLPYYGIILSWLEISRNNIRGWWNTSVRISLLLLSCRHRSWWRRIGWLLWRWWRRWVLLVRIRWSVGGGFDGIVLKKQKTQSEIYSVLNDKKFQANLTQLYSNKQNKK